MARSLSRIFLCFWFLVPGFCIAQTKTAADDVQRPKDYKNKERFKHFSKRRHEVSKWQINQLKEGSLLVRLKTNQLAINALKKAGNSDYATVIENETWIQNKIIVRAYTNHFKFCKVYFFYSQFSDSILNGTRKGIFLDTNLQISPDIEMAGKFYLIAEEDYEYSTSIGYVKEDTARYMIQEGSKSGLCPIILKNKYGHQLVDPFPYKIFYGFGSTRVTKKVYEKNASGQFISANIYKSRTMAAYINYVTDFDYRLHKFYSQVKGYEVTDPDVKPFLY